MKRSVLNLSFSLAALGSLATGCAWFKSAPDQTSPAVNQPEVIRQSPQTPAHKTTSAPASPSQIAAVTRKLPDGSGGGPYLENYTYPESMSLQGGPRTKRIDCGKAYVFADEPNRLYLTWEFGKEVDNNGQPLAAEAMPADDASKRASFGRAMASYGRHWGTFHNICKAQAGRYELQNGKSQENVDKIYGAGWESQSDCMLPSIIAGCKQALGLQ